MKNFFIKLGVLTVLVIIFQFFILASKINSFEQLKTIEKAIKEKTDVVYFGDSSASNYGLDDSDKRPLPEMIKDFLGERTLSSIDNPAYAAEVFLEFTKYIVRKGYYPEFVVIPINLRSFSPSWDKNPGYQFEDQKAMLRSKLDFMIIKSTEAFDKENRLGEISQAEFENTRVFNGYQDVGRAKDFESHDFRYYSEENMEKSILYFYMFYLNEDHEKLVSLSETARILKENNIKPIFYLTPVDYQTGEKYYPGQFLERIDQKRELIKSVLENQGVEVMDLTTRLGSEFFAWERYPNEHLNEKGRKYVARKISEKISGAEEKNQEECKQYNIDQCPSGCAICPPCEVCSSVSCNSLKFCRSIGFDPDWYDGVRLQLERIR